ncbi:MAG: hypothetical protein JWM59_989 [Verrucomicrobiales bacterium]|nr:hypothetical protein [Verrucomicrobiales bacterium]
MELLATGKPVQELAEELRISASLLTAGGAVPRSRRSGAQERPPEAGAPKRTSCGSCGGNTPASRWRMTF